jgi:hypothetical protein
VRKLTPFFSIHEKRSGQLPLPCAPRVRTPSPAVTGFACRLYSPHRNQDNDDYQD